jgi:hypothetical protein
MALVTLTDAATSRPGPHNNERKAGIKRYVAGNQRSRTEERGGSSLVDVDCHRRMVLPLSSGKE